jgi:hypothetical protein
MKPTECARGHEVPVATCDACREAAAVTSFLSTLARERDPRPLPDADDLYRRARIVERLFHAPVPVERAMRRLQLAQLLAILVSAVALGAWLLRVTADAAQQLPLPALLTSPQAIAIALGAAALAAALPLLLALPLLVED